MKCTICKNKLANYMIIWNNVRGDTNNTCKIVQCNICEHKQLMGYNKDLKKHYYEDTQTKELMSNFKFSFENIFEKEKIECILRIKYLKKSIKLNDKKVIDIGSGYLTFPIILENMTNCIVSALEPSGRFNISMNHPASGDFYKNNKIKIYKTYLTDDFSHSHSEKYDLVTLWHVLEHISSDEIDSFLHNVMKICKKGGCVFIEVPNGNDELLKIDAYKNIHYMIHHISYFTKKSLELLLCNNNIKNYIIDFKQRYGLNNYLNWIYDLKHDYRMDVATNTNDYEKLWIDGKIKNECTDTIIIKIIK